MAFAVDIAMVKRAESKLGRKLPLGYVAKMCQHNGGEVDAGPDDWVLHPIFDDSDRTRLKRTCNDILHETKWNRENCHAFPEDVLVIGTNGGGDLLVFRADSQSDGFGDAVFWWDHETGELNKVADDFSALMEEQP